MWVKSSAQGWGLLCQVSEWIQRVLTIGAAFAGANRAEGLRNLLTAQAENFFRSAACDVRGFACLGGKSWSQDYQGQASERGMKPAECQAVSLSMDALMCWLTRRAYHGENLEGLHSMLEKELWQRIPSSPAGKQDTLLQFTYQIRILTLHSVDSKGLHAASQRGTPATMQCVDSSTALRCWWEILSGPRKHCRGPGHCRGPTGVRQEPEDPQGRSFRAPAGFRKPLAKAEPAQTPGGGHASGRQAPAWVRQSCTDRCT